MADKGSVGRVTQASALLKTEDFMRERAISLTHSGSGHLSTLITVWREIEALLTHPAKDNLDRLETLWNSFVDFFLIKQFYLQDKNLH